MITETKKLFFRKVLVILEDDKIDEIAKKNYSSIVVISHKNLVLTKFKVKEKTTAIIDLSKSNEEIFSRFNETTRNEIRKTDRISDLKIVVDDKSFDKVYTLYKKFEFAQKRVPFSRVDLVDCMIFSAYFKGELISSIFVDKGQKELRIRYIFSKRLETEDRELYRTIAYATRRLMWEICLWGKNNNFDSLDLASVNFKNPSVSNITKFKMSFGGQIVNEYTYIYKSTLFTLFEKLVPIKIFFKKLFRK